MTTQDMKRRLSKLSSQLAPSRRVFIVEAGSREEIDRQLAALSPLPTDGILTVLVAGWKGPAFVHVCK